MKGLGDRLARVRGLRAKPLDRSALIGGDVAAASGDVLKRARGMVEIAEVWRSIAPAELESWAWPKSLNRGTLLVAVRGAAWRGRVDQWLRSGGSRALTARCGTSVRKIKIETVED
jgi:hypothetical protein